MTGGQGWSRHRRSCDSNRKPGNEPREKSWHARQKLDAKRKMRPRARRKPKSDRLRKEREEIEERERQHREQLERVARQASELEARFARLSTSMTPVSEDVDPEATQLHRSTGAGFSGTGTGERTGRVNVDIRPKPTKHHFVRSRGGSGRHALRRRDHRLRDDETGSG